jgi:hypothetical protein
VELGSGRKGKREGIERGKKEVRKKEKKKGKTGINK